jgi:DNA polymerase-1
MGIKHTEIRDAEVDDAIASYALTKDDDTEIFISSFDSDYFQLLRDDVKLIR